MAGPPREVAYLVLAGCMVVAFLVLLFAGWLAARSRKPSPRKPPRKTFEYGRRLGRLRLVASTEAACAALRGAPVAELVGAQPHIRRVDVVMRRTRNQPCAQVAGFLAGLFESAWAHEVLVTHPECAGTDGGDCRYVVQRAPISSALPREAASIPGSGGAPRRSPQARFDSG